MYSLTSATMLSADDLALIRADLTQCIFFRSIKEAEVCQYPGQGRRKVTLLISDVGAV